MHSVGRNNEQARLQDTASAAFDGQGRETLQRLADSTVDDELRTAYLGGCQMNFSGVTAVSPAVIRSVYLRVSRRCSRSPARV